MTRLPKRKKRLLKAPLRGKTAVARASDQTSPLPPAARSRAALGLTAAAARGEFALQVCDDCGAVQYPPREVCRVCLSDRLVWRAHAGAGELLAETTLHRSQEPYFQERVPLRIGTVRIDGVNAIVFVHQDAEPAPCHVRLRAVLDRSGQAMLVAVPPKGKIDLPTDAKLRALMPDPHGR